MPQEENNIMRSQTGARPTGTDGSDFWHRESIAWQYKISSFQLAKMAGISWNMIGQCVLGTTILPNYRRVKKLNSLKYGWIFTFWKSMTASVSSIAKSSRAICRCDLVSGYSTINKSRLKLDMFIHGLMSFFMLIRLLPAIFAFWGIPQPQFMKRWRFPPPRPWEFAWFVSTVTIVFGWKAIPRNVTVLLRQYIIGTVVFGLLPVLYGIIEQFDDLLGYLENKKLALYFFTYPAVLVWYMFLAIAAQLHMFGIYFSIRLLRAWKASESKPKLR